MVNQGCLFSLTKLFFSGSIKKIQDQLENDPELRKKQEKAEKSIKDLKDSVSDFEKKYG